MSELIQAQAGGVVLIWFFMEVAQMLFVVVLFSVVLYMCINWARQIFRRLLV